MTSYMNGCMGERGEGGINRNEQIINGRNAVRKEWMGRKNTNEESIYLFLSNDKMKNKRRVFYAVRSLSQLQRGREISLVTSFYFFVSFSSACSAPNNNNNNNNNNTIPKRKRKEIRKR
eukprot:gene9815-6891_t